MLFVLIPTAWLAVLTLLVCVCRVAADADVDPGSIAPAVPGPIGERLILSARPNASGHLLRRRNTHPPRLQAVRPTVRRRRVTTHGIR